MRRKRKPKTVTTPDAHLHPPPRFFILIRYLVLGVFSCIAVTAVADGGVFAAQNAHEKPYALIFGTVWGPDNHPVYGVPVKIRRAHDKKAHWELSSNHTGEFAQRVPAGREDYVIWAEVKDYKSQNGKQLRPGEVVTVHIEYDERVDTSLHLK